MITNKDFYDLLLKYDIYHSSITKGFSTELNINYKSKNIVEINLIRSGSKSNINKNNYLFYDDFEFESSIFPKLIQRFITKNSSITKNEIMGNQKKGTIIISRTDQKESLIVRTCTKETIDLINSMCDIAKRLKSTITFNEINIQNEKEDKISRYLSCNIAMDYSSYRTDFMDHEGKSNFFDFSTRKSFLEKENRNDESNLENLMILDIARYAYKIGMGSILQMDKQSIFEEIKEQYKEDSVIVELCNQFKEISYDEESIFLKALICADYEKNNEGFIMENISLIKEAMDAEESGVTFGSKKFLEYWDGKRRYYKMLGNDELVKICSDFLNNNRLILKDRKPISTSKKTVKTKKESIVSKLKQAKEKSRPDFFTMINDPLVINENPKEKEEKKSKTVDVKKEEKNEAVMDIIKERDQIKKDAEEFAKMILKAQKERKELLKAAEEQAQIIFNLEKENEELKRLAEENAESIFKQQQKEEIKVMAEEQARRIIELEKENEELKRLAEENAESIFKQQQKEEIKVMAEQEARRIIELEKENEELKRLAEETAKSIFEKERNKERELKLREEMDESPIPRSDIDKIQYLLTSLSDVKELDFVVNHPTVMQEVSSLEKKIIAYLATHKNIIEEEIKEEKEEVIEETKPPAELLAILKNVYTASHMYEKEGRHTVINIVLENDKYHITLYSVKNDNDDVLTDVYFDSIQFKDDVIKEICDIYSNNAVIVASKTDNLPNGFKDYLVIDNQDNAIKFMGCPEEVIEIAKAYL